MKYFIIAALLAMVSLGTASAGVIDTAQKDASHEAWSAWGGEVGVRWNRDLLKGYGVSIGAPMEQIRSSDPRPNQWFSVRQSGGLTFDVANGSLRQFVGGSLQARGGFVLDLADGSHIDLRNFTVRLRPDNNQILDVVGADGKTWFYIDKIMFELVQNKTRLAIKAADLRVTLQLAARIGHAEIADYAVADMVFNTDVNVTGSDVIPARVCSPAPFPGVAVPGVDGATYQADLFMDSIHPQFMRCQGCTSASNDGQVMFAPSSKLKNNVNDGSIETTIGGDPLGKSDALYTANVSWHTMFSGNSAPWGNDQHPYLIWNLYRLDSDGTIHQIGRSGLKHAWLTVNGGCLDSCYDSHNLGRGCDDTYSTGNNDASYDLGPRSEVIPAKGIWGRCGSKWDPDCTGSGDHYTNGNGNYDDRMLVSESQMGAANHPGSTYLFESWYLARGDINIYNSMASVNVNVAKSGSNWVMNGISGYKLGGVIDRWVDPASPGPDAMNSEISVPDGHAKVVVKVTDLGDGSWRYDYAVMNFDFAYAITEGSEPYHLNVISNKGFGQFSVPLPAGAVASAITFDDGDLDATNDWTASTDNGRVTWTAGEQSLDWGTLYAFSATVNSAPVDATSILHVAQTERPIVYTAPTLAPSPVAPSDVVFKNGFELP